MNTKFTFILFIAIGSMLLLSFVPKHFNDETSKNNESATNLNELEKITDIDDNDYKVVVIGEQTWMAENLKVSRYANGDVIPNVQENKEWQKLNTGAWCWYNNDSDNHEVHGKLYNWYAVNDSRGLCPKGWKVPSDADWYELESFIDPTINDPNAVDWRGSEAGNLLKAIPENISPRNILSRANTYNFSATTSGYRHIYGIYLNFNEFSIYWTSSEYVDNLAWYRIMHSDLNSIRRLVDSKKYGNSVRCIKEK